MDPRLRTAVDASVGWYDDLCALHGVGSTLTGGVWLSTTAPPPLHSDAVVVEPHVSAVDLLGRLTDRTHCGVKDSFATLDLSTGALRVLFEASWVHCEPPPARSPSPSWTAVTTAGELATWTGLHDTTGVLLPGLLTSAHFAVLAKYDEAGIVAGAVARLAGGAVDVSNTFAVSGHHPDWAELATVVAARFPDRPLVGYTRGAELDAATAAGFSVVGDLRVWVR